MRPSATSDGILRSNFRRCNFNNDFMGKKITVDGHGHATMDCEADLLEYWSTKRGRLLPIWGGTRETV